VRCDRSDGAPLGRVHLACIIEDAIGSFRCDCRRQLELVFEQIAAQGEGVLEHLRRDGIGTQALVELGMREMRPTTTTARYRGPPVRRA